MNEPGRSESGVPASAGLRWASRTHVGTVRTHNEDSLLTGPALLAVADGMGGHAAGEVASGIAVKTLADAVPTLAADVTGAVRAANRAILAAAGTSDALIDMGTTVTGIALLADGSGLLVFNVGDSRVYAVHEGTLRQVTRDHSVVAELVASGALEPELAGVHPERNVVTRALGVVGDVEVDSWLVAPTLGDRWMICSDGLTNEVAPEGLARVLTTAAGPDEACSRLVALALEGGARDNVTVVVADVVAAADAGEDLGPPREPDHDTQPRPALLTAVPGLSRGEPTSPPPPPLQDVPITRTAAVPGAGQTLITDVPGQAL